jgi:hypothetical protein
LLRTDLRIRITAGGGMSMFTRYRRAEGRSLVRHLGWSCPGALAPLPSPSKIH